VIRDLLGWLDYSVCAQAALVLFAAVFISVSIQLMRAPRKEMEDYAAIPLRDGEENARVEN
jgi:hypothetical protein